MAVVGDVNADGFTDYLFTAPTDDDVATASGQAYLFYGPLTGTLIYAWAADATVSGEAQYDTVEKWEGSVSLDYLLSKAVSLVANWHSLYGWGAGLNIRL